MKYLICAVFTLAVFCGCSSTRENHDSKIEADLRQSDYSEKIIGIWKSRTGSLKIRFFSNGMFLSSQFAYTIKGEEIVENLSGNWHIDSGQLIYVYHDSEDDEWIYLIRDLTDNELILKREDYIEHWHRVSDFNLVVEGD